MFKYLLIWAVSLLPSASLWVCDTRMRKMVEWSLPAVKFYFLNELESHEEVVGSLFGLSSGWLYFMLKGLNLLFKARGRSFTPRWISISSDASGAVLSLAEGSPCFQQDYTSGSVCFANTDEYYLIPVWQRSVCLPVLAQWQRNGVKSAADWADFVIWCHSNPMPSKKGWKGALQTSRSSSTS